MPDIVSEDLYTHLTTLFNDDIFYLFQFIYVWSGLTKILESVHFTIIIFMSAIQPYCLTLNDGSIIYKLLDIITLFCNCWFVWFHAFKIIIH